MNRAERIARLAEQALAIPVAERATFLADVCRGDDALRAEVDALLEAIDEIAPTDCPATLSDDAPGTLDSRLERLRRRPSEDRYERKDVLGQGGMGTVLRIRDRDLRRDLAMKVMGRPGDDGAALRSDAALARFLDEAQITAQLDHPGVPPIHELGVDEDGRVFFTMKVVRGRDLREVIERMHAGDGEWTVTRVLGVLQRMCEAMAFAHSKGVVHRDLKPANVMVGDFGEVYVMDWGLAKVVGATGDGADEAVSTERTALADEIPFLHTVEGDVIGTPAFMSPEQARGTLASVGPATDVYAAGAILYQVLTDRVPYADRRPRTAQELLGHLLEGPPTPAARAAPRAAPELTAICDRAMARDPADRYETMEAMADDLRAFLEGRVVRAHRTGPLVELRKWIGRNPLASSALGLFLLAGVAGLVVERWRYGQTMEQRTNVFRLADRDILDELETRADELWPLRSALAPALRRWLADADALRPRIEAARADLERLRAATGLSDEDEWWRRSLAALLDHADSFYGDDPHAARYADVHARLAFCEAVRRRSLVDAAKAWDEAIRSIGDTGECPRYEGLRLEAQEGLVPLGRDPSSGLWSFAHLQSGAPAELDADGRPRTTEETGIVLVLVPGGTWRIGAIRQEDDAGGAVVFRGALDKEVDGRPVALDPFFVSRFEVTQSQWRRLRGENPSQWRASPTHPVENVSRVACAESARRWGLELPTEAQWEVAARGGTTTPFCVPMARVPEAGNLLDRTYAEARGQTSEEPMPWRDGFAATAPVGSFLPNPYGLFDVIGNVYEWCADGFVPLREAPARPGDGLRAPPTLRAGTIRGGSYANRAEASTSVARFQQGLDPTYRDPDLGFRPVRRLHGP